MDAYVSKHAVIGKNVKLGRGSIVYDNVTIGDNSYIGPYVILGEPSANAYHSEHHKTKATIIGKNAIIRAHTTIYEDVVIGDFFQSGHYAIIREESVIGDHTSFGSCSELPGKSKIGNYVRIHSKVMLSEYNQIDDFVWIFPFVVITNSKHPPHGNLMGCHIHEFAQIFSHAVLLPGLTVGRDAIIGAGALVTKDVPEGRLVIGNPAKDIKAVKDIMSDSGEPVYPWKNHLKDFRGYPWQNME